MATESGASASAEMSPAQDWRRRLATLGRLRAATLASPRTLVVIVAAGAILRLARYLYERSLWLDESYLALNLTTRSYSGLVGTLDFNQGAPVGFLVLERAMVKTFGDGEHVLRFLPFVAGIASLLLFVVVARQLLSRAAVAAAVFLFATLDPLVYYSAETKQYGFDVAVTLLLVALAARVLPNPPRGGRLVALAVAGAIAPWLSHASVFVLAGIGVASIVRGLRERDWRSLVEQSGAYGVWLASFAAEYLLSIRHLHQLQESVAGGGGHGANGLVKNLYVLFSDPGQLPRTAVGVTALLAAAGAVALWRRRPDQLVVIVATTIAALGAGELHKYPIGQRFVLFLLPLAILLVAAGTVELVRSARREFAIVLAAAAAALVFVPAAVTSAQHLVRPPDEEPTRQLLSYISSRWLPGDTLYLVQPSQYAFRYYLTCRDCAGSSTERRHERALWPFRTAHGAAQTAPAIVSESPALVVGTGTGLSGYLTDVQHLAGKHRVWLLFTHLFPLDASSASQALDGRGRRLETVQEGLSLLYLYDFSQR